MDSLKLIPEVFYDVLARLTPGLVLLALLPMAFDASLGSAVEKVVVGTQGLSESTVVALSVVVVAGFVTGHLVAGVSELVRTGLLERLFPRSYRVLEDALQEGDGAYPAATRQGLVTKIEELFGVEPDLAGRGLRRALHLWHDALLASDKQIETKVQKVRAEQRMIEGVFVSIGITLIIYLLRVSVDAEARPVDWLFLGGLVVSVLVSGLRAANLYRAYSWAVINHFMAQQRDP